MDTEQVWTSAVPGAGSGRVDVIGIGTQKSASTWLYQCLIEHPSVRPAKVPKGSRVGFTPKEVNFFNRFYERGYSWYHRWFDFGPWRTIEFSVLYFHDRNVPARIHAYNPEAKLLVTLRNPIDRAFSHHKHEVRRRTLPPRLQDFWTALQENPSYVEQGRYAEHLERWLEYFDRSQLHVILYDDIRADSEGVLSRAFEFLGVCEDFRATRTYARVNDAQGARLPALHRLLARGSEIISEHLGETPLRLAKTTGIPRLVRRLNRVDLDRAPIAPLTPSDRQRLAEYFSDDVERLGRLLGRDLSHWR